MNSKPLLVHALMITAVVTVENREDETQINGHFFVFDGLEKQ